MIYFDVTKAARADHRSGLLRVSDRLCAALGSAATAVVWDEGWRDLARKQPIKFYAADWLLTAEVFAPDERPGFDEFLQSRAVQTAAIFHDAIPLKLPQITWPQSVARHPSYMKVLASFDRVWAVSAASRDELTGFWKWQGLEKTARTEVLTLGADFNGADRVTRRSPASVLSLLCVGILEPRKNQLLLLDAATELWGEGLRFELHLVGRVNPHFGAPIVRRIQSLRRKFSSLRYHQAANDAKVGQLYAAARASVFPTRAEGCGLPLLESLWQGVPCVCSDLPSLRENSAGGGCLTVATHDVAAWTFALRRILLDDSLHARLVRDAVSRPLPTWAEAGAAVRAGLG